MAAPGRRAAEDGFVGQVEGFTAGQEAKTVGDLLPSRVNETQDAPGGTAVAGSVFGACIAAGPAQGLGRPEKGFVVEGDDARLEVGNMEEAVEGGGGFVAVEIEQNISAALPVVEERLPQDGGGGVGEKAAGPVGFGEFFKLGGAVDFFPRAILPLQEQTRLRGGHAKPEQHGLRRSKFGKGSRLAEGGFPFLLEVAVFPFLEPADGGFGVGDGLHELRIRQAGAAEGVGDVIPKRDDPAGRFRPKNQGFVAANLPLSGQADEVVVIEFSALPVALIPFFESLDILFLVGSEVTSEAPGEQDPERLGIGGGRQRGQGGSAIELLEHGGVKGRTGGVAGAAFPIPAAIFEPEIDLEKRFAGADLGVDLPIIAKDFLDAVGFLNLPAGGAGVTGEAFEKI